MKKKIVIPIFIVVLVLNVLFLPIPKGTYDDGGTQEFCALTYKIVFWNKIMAEVDENGETVHSTYDKVSVFWYPDNKKSIDELWETERSRVYNPSVS